MRFTMLDETASLLDWKTGKRLPQRVTRHPDAYRSPRLRARIRPFPRI